MCFSKKGWRFGVGSGRKLKRSKKKYLQKCRRRPHHSRGSRHPWPPRKACRQDAGTRGKGSDKILN